MDLMGLLAQVALLLSAAAFVSGFLITVVSGSARAVKIWLAIIGVLGFISIVIALILTNNLFVYLMFQFIVVVLILCFIVIAGAVCGGGVYVLIHRKAPGLDMKSQDREGFLTLDEFVAAEGVSEDKAIARIRSGFYEGGRMGGEWFISKSELSRNNFREKNP